MHSITNFLLFCILILMFAYAMTDGFASKPTALEQHNELMERIGLE